VDVTLIDLRQRCPIPDRLAGVAAFDRPIEIVPMVEHPQRIGGCRPEIYVVERTAELHLTDEGERAVEHACTAVSRDDDRTAGRESEAANQVTLGPQAGEIQRGHSSLFQITWHSKQDFGGTAHGLQI